MMSDDHTQPKSGDVQFDEGTVRTALRKVKDPEAGLNIIDLGLVYDVAVAERKVHVKMTLTSPACPVGPQNMHDADTAVRDIDGVEDVKVELVWDPYWTPERIDPKVRAYLGF
jgi:metal-sulfur cluster biosynthetic enzyme